jgi:predicted CopG family antitoxin
VYFYTKKYKEMSKCKEKKAFSDAFSAIVAKKTSLFFGKSEIYCNFTTNLD